MPVGTTLHTYKLGLDTEAKLKLSELGLYSKVFPRNTTDNLSFDPPEVTRPFQQEYDKIMTKYKYGVSDTDMRGWEPKTVSKPNITNMSGQTYDIINNSPIKHCANSSLGLLDKQIVNRRHVISEIVDKQYVSAKKTNVDHI